MTSALIDYLCFHKEHWAEPSEAGAAANPMTIHEQAWAYCPGGSLGDHEWHKIEPLLCEQVTRLTWKTAGSSARTGASRV